MVWLKQALSTLRSLHELVIVLSAWPNVRCHFLSQHYFKSRTNCKGRNLWAAAYLLYEDLHVVKMLSMIEFLHWIVGPSQEGWLCQFSGMSDHTANYGGGGGEEKTKPKIRKNVL